VTTGALLALRRDHVYLAELLERAGEGGQPCRMNAVVVGHEQQGHAAEYYAGFRVGGNGALSEESSVVDGYDGPAAVAQLIGHVAAPTVRLPPPPHRGFGAASLRNFGPSDLRVLGPSNRRTA